MEAILWHLRHCRACRRGPLEFCLIGNDLIRTWGWSGGRWYGVHRIAPTASNAQWLRDFLLRKAGVK